MVTRVHVGGHITLVFSIHDDDPRPAWQGSRGAGLVLDAGVSAVAHPAPGDAGPVEAGGAITVRVTDLDGTVTESDLAVDGTGADHADVVMQPYAALLATLPQAWRPVPGSRLDLQLDLPRSQGFGMSAAGLVAAGHAWLEQAGLAPDDARQAALALAHVVERRISGGLGDVLGLAAGGLECRLEPGAPYLLVDDGSGPSVVPGPGVAVGTSLGRPAVVCWSPEAARRTTDYIDAEAWRGRITAVGSDAMTWILAAADEADQWSRVLDAAADFEAMLGLDRDPAIESLRRRVAQVLGVASGGDRWSALLCMLGTSVVLVPTHQHHPVSLLADDAEALALGLDAHGIAARRVSLM